MTEPVIKERLLPKFSVSKPVSVTMLFLAILVIGFIAYQKIKIDLLPSGMNFTGMGVWVPYRDANPKEIEQQIVKPIEGQLKTVKNLKRIYSYSFRDGNWFWMEFDRKANMDLAYAQITDRLERSRPYIPEEIEHFYIRRRRENEQPVIYMGISYDKSIKDPNFLVTKYIQQPIEGVKGVANVELWGFKEKYFQIVLSDDKIKAYGVNLADLIPKLRNDNFSISSGYVFQGNKKLLLKSSMRYKSLDDLKNIQIKPGLTLSNIADVKFDFDEDYHSIMRVNGKVAAGVGIFKESNANSVEVCKLIKKKLDEQLKSRDELKGINYYIFWNMGETIEESINNVQLTGLWGGLFAFFVLLYFLRRIKMTVMLAMAIPFSLLVTLIVMYFIGWTLNLITLMGLMISVGMVVDNAIVITENIYRFHNMGYDLKTSAIKGASEVGLAITLATFTTIVVFLPMMLMSGNDNFTFFMVRIGSPVILALLGSLFIALVFIPLVSTKLSTKKVVHKGFVLRTSLKYRAILDKVLQHKLDAGIIILLIILSMFFPMNNLKHMDDESGGSEDAFVNVRFPSSYTIEKSDSILHYIASKIMERDSIYNIKNLMTRTHKYHGWIEVYLHPDKNKQWYQVVFNNIKKAIGVKVQNRLTRDQLSKDIKEHLPEIPGVRMRTTWRDQGGGNRGISYQLQGNDTDVLVEIAEDLENQIKLMDGVISVDNSMETGNDEIQIRIDREKAQMLGVNPLYVSQYLAFNYRERKVNDFKTSDREIPVFIKTDPEARKSMQRLKNIKIMDNQGHETRLSAIADFEVSKTLGRIRRENGKTSIELTINTGDEDINKMSTKIERILKNYQYPTGYSYQKGLSMRRREEENSQMKYALILSILFVFIIMGVLFESFILPLSVIIAIPAAFTGSYWLLYLTGTPFGIMAGIGFVVLVGVVVNNAIVLIDMINQFRISGMSRRDAILEAAEHRFRPILMTALTTICGLLPMALGNTSMIGIPYKPMGMTMIGGLISSTFLTLFAVPIFYSLLDDLRSFWKRLMLKF